MSAKFHILASDGYESYFGKLNVRKVGMDPGSTIELPSRSSFVSFINDKTSGAEGRGLLTSDVRSGDWVMEGKKAHKGS